MHPGASNEQDRLAALERYDVLDTSPEEAFDRVTRLIRSIFAVSMSTVTLIDGHRQWFKSEQGMANLVHRMCRIAHKRDNQIEVVFE